MNRATRKAIEQDLINQELSDEEIASKYGILLDTVYDILDDLQEELDEQDGQPDEQQEWHDYDPDC